MIFSHCDANGRDVQLISCKIVRWLVAPLWYSENDALCRKSPGPTVSSDIDLR